MKDQKRNVQLTRRMIEGYEEDLRAKEAEKAQLLKLRGQYKSHSSDEDGDNSEVRDLNRMLEVLDSEMAAIRYTLENCDVIDIEESSSVVTLGSNVTIEIREDEDEVDILKVTLSTSHRVGVTNFSLNSPLGQCIFGKPVGFEGAYLVRSRSGESSVSCKILAIE